MALRTANCLVFYLSLLYPYVSSFSLITGASGDMQQLFTHYSAYQLKARLRRNGGCVRKCYLEARVGLMQWIKRYCTINYQRVSCDNLLERYPLKRIDGWGWRLPKQAVFDSSVAGSQLLLVDSSHQDRGNWERTCSDLHQMLDTVPLIVFIRSTRM